MKINFVYVIGVYIINEFNKKFDLFNDNFFFRKNEVNR